MSDPNQIRINELARELEVKAKAILDYLPELDVHDKKTHSSSIDTDVAVKVRKHFQDLAEAEVAAEKAKIAAEAAAKAAKSRPAAVAPAARPAAPTAPAAGPAAAPARPSAPPASAVAAKPAVPGSAAPAMGQVAAKPAAPVASTAKPVPGAPLVQRPGVAPATPGAKEAPLRPGAPAPGTAARPGAPATMRPAAGAPAGRPGAPYQPRPSGPGPRPQHPTGPPRPGQRPGGGPRQGMPLSEKGPPKAEPGKPIYARKPAARARPLMEKRFEEGERKLHPVRARPGPGERRSTAVAAAAPVVREPRDVTITEGITVRDLAEKLDLRAKDLLKALLDRGMFVSINQALDVQTATSLAESFSGVVKVITFEEEAVQEVSKEEKAENQQPRAPVVTVMGHVDHGKTSLLDAIRKSNVVDGEAGGITQHIGAYKVEVSDRRIVFIDTPGHEAFTRMRARGARITDIVVLVVGADDGVMPQTQEAIDHARAASVPIVVAVNKIDKPEGQPERVKRQLADLGLMPEEWGGDTVTVEVSAKTGKNLERLLEMILLVADIRELKANPAAPAAGTVLESRMDKGRGPVATVLVQNGTLRAGDVFICGAVYGKVRAMFDDRGQVIKDAGPSTPVEVLGLQGVPDAGDQFQVTDEAKARHIVEYRQGKLREAALAKTATARITLEQLHEQLKAGGVKELPIVVKADVQGSVEVLSEMLPKLSTDQVKLRIIHASVGAVTETDILLASASNAIIIAFNVRPDRKASEMAQQENVDIRLHTIIYEVSDELKKAMVGLLEPVIKETYLGRAEVRNTFRIKGVGTIAGCSVQDGIIKRDAEVRVLRDSVVIYTGRVNSLKRFKDDATEVRTGFECGIGISNFNDVKVGDVLECFTVQKLAVAEAAAQAR